MPLFKNNRDVDTTLSTIFAFAGFIGLGIALIILDVKLKQSTNAERYLSRDIILYLFGALSNWITAIIANHHGKKMAEIQKNDPNRQHGGNQ